MFRFAVSGMSGDHCAQTISRAFREVDPTAKVEIDLAGGEVAVQSTSDPSRVARAIEPAGYAAQQKTD
jgi:copper chaperone